MKLNALRSVTGSKIMRHRVSRPVGHVTPVCTARSDKQVTLGQLRLIPAGVQVCDVPWSLGGHFRQEFGLFSINCPRHVLECVTRVLPFLDLVETWEDGRMRVENGA